MRIALFCYTSNTFSASQDLNLIYVRTWYAFSMLMWFRTNVTRWKLPKNYTFAAHFVYERQNFCNSGCITVIRTVFLKALNRLQQGVRPCNKFLCNGGDGYSLDNSRKTMVGSLFSLYLLKDLRSYNAWSDKNQLSDQKPELWINVLCSLWEDRR